MSDAGERGYAKVSLADVEPRELDGLEPTLLSVGYELRPSKMRPNVWRFEVGEATNDHRHAEQEELYVVLAGSFDVHIEGDDGRGTEFDLEARDYMVVPPESWRKLTATEDSSLLVVGAPPVKDDDERRSDA